MAAGEGMSTVSEVHEEKETLSVDVEIPGHAPRGAATPLFIRTKRILMERMDGRCFICNGTEAEVGPLEAHHMGIERSFATAPIEWEKVKADFPNFDWEHFDAADPLSFVDDMSAQGLLLCAKHHRGKDEGIHTIPWPLFIVQRYLKDGYKFSDLETIHDFT